MRGNNKKSGNPTQPGHRSNISRTNQNRKTRGIIHQIAEFFKSLSWKERLLLPLIAVSLLVVVSWEHFVAFYSRLNWKGRAALALLPLAAALACVFITPNDDSNATEAEPPQRYIFAYESGYPVDWENLTTAWAYEAGMEKRYDITDAERWTLASVITAEAGSEPFAGKVAVAQCILQACEDDGIRPKEALTKYAYSSSRPRPYADALEAVQAVFDFGHKVSAEPIKYYYAPALVYSEWHESQAHVITINNHKFFKEKGAQTHERSN